MKNKLISMLVAVILIATAISPVIAAASAPEETGVLSAEEKAFLDEAVCSAKIQSVWRDTAMNFTNL